jgi:hypothetical protein
MLRFLADENFHFRIVLGMLRREPSLDIVRVQDVGLMSADDSQVLQWAADEDRILLSHDVRTITHFAYERVRRGLPMPGVFEVNLNYPMERLIDELLVVAECSSEDEWEGQVRYIPL